MREVVALAALLVGCGAPSIPRVSPVATAEAAPGEPAALVPLELHRATYAELPPRTRYEIREANGVLAWSCAELPRARGVLPREDDACARGALPGGARSVTLVIDYDDYDGSRRRFEAPLELTDDTTSLRAELRFEENAPRHHVWLDLVAVYQHRDATLDGLWIDEDGLLHNDSDAPVLPTQANGHLVRAFEYGNERRGWRPLRLGLRGWCGNSSAIDEIVWPGETADMTTPRGHFAFRRPSLHPDQRLRRSDRVRIRTEVGLLRQHGQRANGDPSRTLVARILDVHDVVRDPL